MITVVVVIHLLVALSMIGLILLQKTEGNASGGGFSAASSLGSMMQPRPRSNPLSRATVILGIAFFATSLGLALLSKQAGPAPSIFETPDAKSAPKVNELRADPTPASGSTPAPSLDAQPAAPAAPAGAPAVPNN